MKLLRELTGISSPSGDESRMTEYIRDYIRQDESLNSRCTIIDKSDLQDNLIVRVGEHPRTALFVHIDTTGFMVGFGNELIPIGSPAAVEGDELVGKDDKGSVCAKVQIPDKGQYQADFFREINPGTLLTYYPNFRTKAETVCAPYLDNRIGVYTALKLAETDNDFVIAFTTFEEHGFGGAQVCGKYIYEQYGLTQSIILDGTWDTKHVKAGKGPAVSLRDKGIPRRVYLNRIINLLTETELTFQIEVEKSGGSDGLALQSSPYPFDWVFIGPPLKHPHSASEQVQQADIENTLKVYEYLIKNM